MTAAVLPERNFKNGKDGKNDGCPGNRKFFR